MINYCKTCKHEGEEIGVCSTCFYNHILDERDIPPTEYEKKPSYADRIRAMSDEALADWLSIYCRGKTPPYEPCRKSCEACWLDWLRQEAEPEL